MYNDLRAPLFPGGNAGLENQNLKSHGSDWLSLGFWLSRTGVSVSHQLAAPAILKTYAYSPGRVEGRLILISSPCCVQSNVPGAPSKEILVPAFGDRDLTVTVFALGFPSKVAYREEPF